MAAMMNGTQFRDSSTQFDTYSVTLSPARALGTFGPNRQTGSTVFVGGSSVVLKATVILVNESA